MVELLENGWRLGVYGRIIGEDPLHADRYMVRLETTGQVISRHPDNLELIH